MELIVMEDRIYGGINYEFVEQIAASAAQHSYIGPGPLLLQRCQIFLSIVQLVVWLMLMMK